VLRGILEDDRWFAFVAEPDKTDDWKDQKVWIKGNPNLAVSVWMEDLLDDYREAEGTASYVPEFKRSSLGMWTEARECAITIDQWDMCAGEVDLDALTSLGCYAGLDLSSKWDVTALEIIWQTEDGTVPVHSHFWLPEGRLDELTAEDQEIYRGFARRGELEFTPGPLVDYDIVRARVNEYAKRFKIQEIAYDPWNATQIATQLAGDGLKMVETRQGFRTMSEPTKQFLGLVKAGRLRPGRNGMLRWMALNLETASDPAGNVKPLKRDKSRNKIDGIVAIIMALSRAMLRQTQVSIYETMGV
jgi:phage terminase large subunit-like protein